MEDGADKDKDLATTQDPMNRGTTRPDTPQLPLQTLRRSPRIRTPRKIFNLLTYSMLLCICIAPVELSLQNMSPIVWRRTDTPIVTGMNRVLITINYKSPCNIFSNSYFRSYNTDEANALCESQFRTNFLNPMKNFCKIPIDHAENNLLFGQSREKRVAVIAIGVVAVISVAVTAIIGLAASAYVQVNQNEVEIETLKKRNEEMLQNLKIMQENDEHVKGLIDILQKEIKGIHEEFIKVGESFNGSQKHFTKYNKCSCGDYC